jgi:hypothetical protein
MGRARGSMAYCAGLRPVPGERSNPRCRPPIEPHGVLRLQPHRQNPVDKPVKVAPLPTSSWRRRYAGWGPYKGKAKSHDGLTLASPSPSAVSDLEAAIDRGGPLLRNKTRIGGVSRAGQRQDLRYPL